MPPKELKEAYSNRTVRPSVRVTVRVSVRPCVHPSRFRVPSISPIFFEVGVWMHLGMAECRIPFSGHCDLEL